VTAPELNVADRAALTGLVRRLSVVFGRVTLSSGKEADYYVDLRRATLHHEAAPLIGRVSMDLLTADVTGVPDHLLHVGAMQFASNLYLNSHP
jgi:orotate phosphoribosyltransferase